MVWYKALYEAPIYAETLTQCYFAILLWPQRALAVKAIRGYRRFRLKWVSDYFLLKIHHRDLVGGVLLYYASNTD